MKAIETLTYQGKLLVVLVETKQNDETNGYISYFVDDLEITNWGSLLDVYQQIFTALADRLCQRHNLTKYSY